MKPPRKVKRKSGGHVWEVRYRDGGRHRSKVFDRKADAENFQAEVRRRKQLGTIAHLHAGDDLLADFAVEWWRLHAKPNLEPSTLNHYSQVWDCHVLPGLGGYRLKELTPEVVSEFRAMLADKGVGDATIRKAMFTLQSVMGLAVLHGRVATNSVKAVRKPRQRSRRVRPLAPITVETIRTKLGLRDATLVSVLAYAGLRPGEALGLQWQNVRDRTLLVDRSVSLGREKSTKTNATRTVRLIPVLIEDLGVWLRAARPGEDAELVFPRPDGKPWTEDDYNNWRRRNYKPAAKAAGLAEARPYDLRHSFVSLLIHEGVSIVEVARQAGHAPEECLRTYAHTFEEFDPADRVPAAEAIRRAREEVLGPNVRSLYARTPKAEAPEPKFGSMTESRRPDSNRRHPLYERGALPTELRRRGGECSPASTPFLMEIVVARGVRRRLLGLAWRRHPPDDCALLFPHCRSVHTFGMLFAIDVVFLDSSGAVVRIATSLRPGRVVLCRGAAAAVEVRAGEGGIIAAMAEGQRNRFAEALDPRTPIYRDTYNEFFVFLLSAGGAIAGTQVPVYILMAITGLWGLIPFVAACVVFELGVIFGLARPQMKPKERVAWAGAWAVATALMAVAFYYLVAEPTL